MDLKLKGKRAFVAASSKGLGLSTARVLAQEGCRVAINGRNSRSLTTSAEELKSTTGADIYSLIGDVTLPAIPDQLVDQAADLMGGLDLLVTNSGGPPAKAFEDISDELWQQSLDLVFLSHVRLIRASLPYLRKSSHPSVLTVTSYSVKQPIPNLILSNSIRLATIGLTKTLSQELGGEGIRFNSILPGWTRTDRVEELMTARAKKNQTSIEDEIEKQAQVSPLGRMAEPDEFGKTAAFLLSPAASYITGMMLTVDGGAYQGTL